MLARTELFKTGWIKPIPLSEPKIRKYEIGEEPKIIDLLDTVFNRWPHFDLPCTALDHWLWKYKNNPQGDSLVYVAEMDDKLVGCHHAYFNRIKVGTEIYLGMQNADTAILVEYRGKGLYKYLYNAAATPEMKKKIGIIYGVSTNPIIHKANEKMSKDRFSYQLKLLVKINNIYNYIKPYKFTKKVWLWTGYNLSKIYNIFKNLISGKTSATQDKIQIVDIKAFDKGINTFWDEIKKEYNFITVINKEYLNWRYGDNRGGKYHILQAQIEGKIVGFICLRVNSFGDETEGNIVSLYSLPGQHGCEEALLDTAIKYFEKSNVNMIKYCISNGHRYQELFTKKGFIDSRKDLFYSINNHNLEDNFETFMASPPEKILFQYGDFDWI